MKSTSQAKTLFQRAAVFARMVKIEHSVFALPFAYIGAFTAADGWPGLWPLLFLSLAMVSVRSFAMAVNRIVDLPIDRLNPRTATRPLVTGEISLQEALIFTIFSALIFVLACAGLNAAALALSPLALAWSALYSFTKRVTWLCHFVLGSVLGLAPIAGWIGVLPSLDLTYALFFLGVLFWVAGFDILYSCQDVAFDRDQGLRSIPARFGVKTALLLSSFCHVNASLFFLLAGLAAGLDWIYLVVWLVVSAILSWEHTLVRPDDLSRIDTAFFTLNGYVAVLLFLGVLVDLLF
jgi:4-hydroxybenzoate polyprenyltransferase